MLRGHFVLLALIVSVTACAPSLRMPTRYPSPVLPTIALPQPRLRPVLVASGQSNMNTGRLALESAGATTFGHSDGARPISYWGRHGDGWLQLEAAIRDRTDAAAFVWFQGESDAIHHLDLHVTRPPTDPAVYQAALTDLIHRVRHAVGRPLPVLLTELSPHEDAFAPINAALRRVADEVEGVRLVYTHDLTWRDSRHLDEAGLAAWAARVLAAAVKTP